MCAILWVGAVPVDDQPREETQLSENVVVLTSENWKKEVMEADGPVLVDFWASWCAPCRMIAPAVEQVAEAFAGRAKVGKLNVDENPEIAGEFGIRSIPTLLVFKDGKVAEQRVGALPHPMIAEMVEKQLSTAGSAQA
jgi:thioredoxin 1